MKLAKASKASQKPLKAPPPPPPPLPLLAAAVTAKVRDTGVAAAMLALPSCEAVIVQLPTASSVKAAPLTLQTAVVLEAKLIARLALDVALRLKAADPSCRSAIAAKVIVCGVGATAKLRVTLAAEL